MSCPSLYIQMIKTGTKPCSQSHISIFIPDSFTPASLFSFHIPTAECIHNPSPSEDRIDKRSLLFALLLSFQLELLPVQAKLGAFCSWSWAATLKYVEIGFARYSHVVFHFQLPHDSVWLLSCFLKIGRVN